MAPWSLQMCIADSVIKKDELWNLVGTDNRFLGCENVSNARNGDYQTNVKRFRRFKNLKCNQKT